MKPMWNNRNLRLLVLGQASSLVGNYTLKFALFMYILEVTGSAAPLCHLPVGGHGAHDCPVALWGDPGRPGDRRKIMVTLDACAGLAVLLAALTLPLGHALGVIGALLVVLSVLGAFESPTVQACVPQMLEGEDLVRGNAVVAQVQAVASLATPFLGSVLYAAVGLVPVLWGAAGCFLVTALLECCLQLPPPAPVEGLGVREVLKQDLAASGRFPLAGGAGDVKAAPPGCLGELLPGGNPGGGVSLPGAHCAGPLRHPLRRGGECPGGGGGAGDLGAVWGAGGGVLPVPVWVQLLLHLCYRRHPGADPSESHGEGDVLCVHPLPLRPAPGAAGVHGALFDRFAGQVFWVLLPHGFGGVRRGFGHPGLLPAVGGTDTGREIKAKICPLKCNI